MAIVRISFADANIRSISYFKNGDGTPATHIYSRADYWTVGSGYGFTVYDVIPNVSYFQINYDTEYDVYWAWNNVSGGTAGLTWGRRSGNFGGDNLYMLTAHNGSYGSATFYADDGIATGIQSGTTILRYSDNGMSRPASSWFNDVGEGLVWEPLPGGYFEKQCADTGAYEIKNTVNCAEYNNTYDYFFYQHGQLVTYTVKSEAGGGIKTALPSTAQTVVKGNSQAISATVLPDGWGDWSEASTTTYLSRKYYEYSFATWTISSGSGSFKSATSSSTEFTPTSNSVVRATGIGTVTSTEYKYRVRYNANGGSGSMSATDSNSGTTSTGNKSVTISTNSFTRTNYVFTGWNTKADGSGTTYAAGRNSIPHSLTLYAQWALASITLTFQKVGEGTIGRTTGTVPYGSTYTVDTSNALVFSQSGGTTAVLRVSASPAAGYTFSGWSPSSGTVTTATTFTATFTAKQIKITFNANGGSGGPTSQLYTYSNTGTFTLEASTPTRTGYDFLGWSTSSTATTATYQPKQAIAKNTFTSNQTFYAVWQIKQFVMQFAGDRGCTVSKTKSISLPYGTTYQVVTNNRLQFRYNGTIVESCDITLKTGYEFDKWTPSSGTITKVIVFTASTKRKQLPYFFWDLNDGSTDANIIKTGQPVTNLRAAAWNKLNSDIKTLSSYHGITYTFSNVTSGAAISAAAFNIARTGISNIPGHGTLPIVAVTGNTILASMYQAASASLKSAYNTAVDAWNNN